MKKLSTYLENCYGIKKLDYQFNFSNQSSVYAIYASNGSMKTSFAQVFKDISEKKESKDRMFPSRKTTRNVVLEDDNDLPSENVLSLSPFEENFPPSSRTSTLLINTNLRNEYEQLDREVANAKKAFLDEMESQSSSKKSLESEIALTFTKSDTEESFFMALERISSELEKQVDAPFAKIPYDKFFDEKIVNLIKKPEMKEVINEYITSYNKLLENSTYFKKGVFEYYNATQIAKTLASNGFFNAEHTVTLVAEKETVIDSTEQLEKIISEELRAPLIIRFSEVPPEP